MRTTWPICGFLKHYAVQHALDVHAHCLMTDHGHLVVVPRTALALALC